MPETSPASNANSPATVQVATFYVGKYFFGIEVLRVREVLPSQKMTVVPLAPPAIAGLINLRGQIVLALDMRRRLQMEPRGVGMVPMNLIVRTEEGAVSLMVDDIGDVLQLDQANIEPPPENLAPEACGVVRSVCKLKDALLLLLDTDSTIDVGLIAD